MVRTIKAFLSDQDGATAIEYGLLAALLSLAIIGSFTLLGNSLIVLFDTPTAGALDQSLERLNR
ncbi:MAG TPA: Flp family type IVb pilin [Devosia sp.]|nr:Flp family type IVb pilin [Devosia sp.]